MTALCAASVGVSWMHGDNKCVEGRPIQRRANVAPDESVRFRSVRYAGDERVG